MNRSISDSFKSTWYALTGFFSGGGAGRRTESARITSTKLKALEKPDYLIKEKVVEAAPPAPQDPFDQAAEEVLASRESQAVLDKLGVQPPGPAGTSLGRGPRRKTNADMSHFRLASYVASLSPEERAAQEKALEGQQSQSSDGNSDPGPRAS